MQGFTLEFHFSPNEYFTNTVLTKEYFMKCKPDDKEPFTFEGPEIFKCKVGRRAPAAVSSISCMDFV